MFIESLYLRNFRCFGDQGAKIEFDETLTAIVGANGAGKTAIIGALQKLFGTRAEDRRLVREDVHFGRDEEPGATREVVAPPPAVSGLRDILSEAGAASAADPVEPDPTVLVSSRQVLIEVILAFPELDDPVLDRMGAVAEIFRAMSAAGPGDALKARIRLEATWTYGVDDDDIQTEMFWVTSMGDVPFGERDVAKLAFSANDRRRFQVRYLPATRDGDAILRQALRELLVWLEKFGDWSGGREPMAKQWDGMQQLFDDMPAISRVTSELAVNWGLLFDGPHLRAPRLTVLAREIQRALRDLSLTLGPGPGGRHRSVHELSEGQASLFYLALVVTLFKLDAELAKAKPDGFREVEAVRPWLTVLALEEPENHLAPFYLSRMVGLMTEQARSPAVMGLLTTHSASALRRVAPQQVRHIRHNAATLTSKVNPIKLPPIASDAHKFVQEAVVSHPELYFSRLVILGEGRSEEMVLPRVARALHADLELDPAFVAFVPLGGRHVNHFWRLLDGLQIPYVTLLDYDLGRSGGGPRRLKYAVDQLEVIGVEIPLLPRPTKAADWDTLDGAYIAAWIEWLRTRDVFYSRDVDLDMMMLQAFPAAYGAVAGVAAPISTDGYEESVFGKGKGLEMFDALTAPTALHLAQYDALFKKGSKPVAHVEALAELEVEAIKARCPEPLKALFDRCRALLGLDVGDL
ncbi:ATP-dependent endonuclease [Caulobacter sp. UNC279MFTsu5.1]|uniref:ATP-dependent nuclease n=1 Tax=Caulobacter sp. UNC279MFTsu5.1 TaxID=1502775 RepID=UPI0003738C9C|nr:AAA family ATPase [Caulobacter sp. UNC279MFTsu5.1]SFJ31012.1 AAA domain-containing protein, putative AbiEii toxin, Type IV TA system [Caulobacter sp. UNC279MFTsu5.1]